MFEAVKPVFGNVAEVDPIAGAALRVLIVKTSFTFCYQHILYTFYLAAVGAVGTVEKL
jgi:hypothetical protein